ncbi:MAG: DUF4258 domain-containing protein [Deltaproteobacteria bacterium]|nr:DUF4258 domain-containing protein [Deltaproteobacteria bacterium]
MNQSQLVFRLHAIQRMVERGITKADIRQVLETGEVIESYPDDKPYPSRLILGWMASRPLHVVVAEFVGTKDLIVVTVYEPDLVRWQPGFKQRRRV